MEEKVATPPRWVAEEHALQGLWGKLTATLRALGPLIKDVSDTPPDAQRGGGGPGAKPQLMRGHLRLHVVRPEVGKARSVEKAVAPKRGWWPSMGPEAAGNGGDRANAALNNTVLLRVARCGRLKSNTQRAVKVAHVARDQLTPIVADHFANRARVANRRVPDPRADMIRCLTLGTEQGHGGIATEIINNDQRIREAIAGLHSRRAPKIKMNLVKESGSTRGIGWVRLMARLALDTPRARWSRGARKRRKANRQATQELVRDHRGETVKGRVAKAVMQQNRRVTQRAAGTLVGGGRSSG